MGYWIRYRDGGKVAFTEGQIREGLIRGSLCADVLCGKADGIGDLFGARIVFRPFTTYPEFKHVIDQLSPVTAAEVEVTESTGFELGPHKFKVIFGPMGLFAGLLVSYLLAPGFARMALSFGEWLAKGFEAGYGGMIIICALLGTALGIACGAYLDIRVRTNK